VRFLPEGKKQLYSIKRIRDPQQFERELAALTDLSGGFHVQGDAIWIVIRPIWEGVSKREEDGRRPLAL
jgi:hypothetical protein